MDATRTTTTRPSVSGPLRLAALPLLGVVAGIVAKAADESGIRWAADLGSYPAFWVLAVALIGRFAPTRRVAALRSSAFFAAMTVAYYAWAALVLGFPWSRLLPVWLVLSATAVAAVAVTVHWATSRPGAVAGALLALVAGVALGGGAGAGRPVQAVADLVTAAVIVLVLPRHRPTRLWAVALTLPMAWTAGELLAVLYGSGVLA